MKDLPKRALTAVIFGIVMIGGICLSRISFGILLLVIQTGGLFEYLRLIRKFQNYNPRQAAVSNAVTIIAGSLVLIYIVIVQEKYWSVYYTPLLILGCLIVMGCEFLYRSSSPGRNGLLNAGGIIYISIPVLCFYSLADNFFIPKIQPGWFPFYASVPLGVLLLIWANDTFAYFAGSLFGKHKILPSVSPKKSWEGFFGGLVFALVTAWLLSKYFTRLGLHDWLIVSVIVTVIGTTGDFFESWIKRRAAVKDSGNLLPGHGGFLDRFDALLFSAPAVAIYLMFAW